MKTARIFLILVVVFSQARANDSKYVESMSKAIGQVYQAKSSDEIQQAINVLDRIGQAEKTKWEPFYYASFGYIMLATRESDGTKKDAFLDQAKMFLDKAEQLKPNDSEITTLDGFLNTIRLSVDPATRGQKYSAASMQAFGKALGINPENPRAMSLMAQMQYGTAKFFNASTDEACATARKAQALFAQAKPSENPLAPAWGKSMADGMLVNCK